MDDIDRDITDLYKENTRPSPIKFLAILLTVVGLNVIINIISFYQESLSVRIVLELISGILMTSFFIWFFLRIYKK
jgi:hypothetical protein